MHGSYVASAHDPTEDTGREVTSILIQALQEVAVPTIRPRILKDHSARPNQGRRRSCSAHDPTEDTERTGLRTWFLNVILVAVPTIRPRILKDGEIPAAA